MMQSGGKGGQWKGGKGQDMQAMMQQMGQMPGMEGMAGMFDAMTQMMGSFCKGGGCDGMGGWGKGGGMDGWGKGGCMDGWGKGGGMMDGWGGCDGGWGKGGGCGMMGQGMKGGSFGKAQGGFPSHAVQPYIPTPIISNEPATAEDIQHVENFLATCEVDQKAADSLRNLPPDLQKMIINKGSLADSRDQTAVLISRMNLAKAVATGNMDNPTMQALKPGDWICPGCLDHQFARNAECRKCGTANPAGTEVPPEVEGFLGSQTLDQHAIDQFKTLGVALQKLVMSRGSLDGARDPTAVLCRRMAQARRGELMAGSGPGGQEAQDGDWYCPGCNDLQFRRNQVCRRCGVPNPAGSPGTASNPGMGGGMDGGMGMMNQMGMQSGCGMNQGMGGGMPAGGLGAASPEEVQTFLAGQAIDDHAREQFIAMGPGLQKLVMSRGSLDGARDPTAVLCTRMRQARSGELQPGTGGSQEPQNGDWYCPGCQDLQFRRNAVCRKCGTPNPSGPPESGKGGGGGLNAQFQQFAPTGAISPAAQNMVPAMPEEVIAFLSTTMLDDNAKQQFQAMNPQNQALVMSRGPLDGARDPTAVLVTRMRQARSGELQPGNGGGTNKQEPSDGDWYCPGCNDLQFRRNTSCRKCGTPNPVGAPAQGGMGGMGCMGGMGMGGMGGGGLFQPNPAAFNQFQAMQQGMLAAQMGMPGMSMFG